MNLSHKGSAMSQQNIIKRAFGELNNAFKTSLRIVDPKRQRVSDSFSHMITKTLI